MCTCMCDFWMKPYWINILKIGHDACCSILLISNFYSQMKLSTQHIGIAVADKLKILQSLGNYRKIEKTGYHIENKPEMNLYSKGQKPVL